MKVIFVGPSLYGVNRTQFSGVELRPPAKLGDITKAVQHGADHIGLIDGIFGSSASVWHKEILYALSCGVKIYGAASMGALRAAECAHFGMIPVGKVASDYMTGKLDDDAAVALTFAPAEFAWQPFTEPLVDAIYTLERMGSAGTISSVDQARITNIAAGIHFTVRTPERIASEAFNDREGRQQFLKDYAACYRSIKTSDALLLLHSVHGACPTSVESHQDIWTFKSSPMWDAFLATNA